MILLGASMPGRNTEQHDIYFGIAEELNDLHGDLLKFWPEAGRKLHIDAWREVRFIDGYELTIVPRNDSKPSVQSLAKLFFINLGGYKKNEFEEFHYKMIVAAKDKGEAIQLAKQTSFYKHTGIQGADSHIDDKYGVDVDDFYEITDILSADMKAQYQIILQPAIDQAEDQLHLGYITMTKLLANQGGK